MKKIKTVFFCQNCGHQSAKWLGKCPSCGEWNQCVEEECDAGKSEDLMGEWANEDPVPINDIAADETDRISTGIAEIDRVLGGGIVGGSAVLIGGDPGIGKSTLLLQMLKNIAEGGRLALYVSGEESATQIKLRGKRIGALSKNLMVLPEVSLNNILKHIKVMNPAIVVIDSIQTVYSSTLTAAPGSVSQIKEGSGKLILMAKKTGIPIFLIGHVTKEGSIAGPRILEHMVDAVLYFEGDSGHLFRIVRGVKNRYGPTNEIGVFEMREGGLVEISNPSALFLSERPKGAAGSVVVPSMEGSRPLLVEIQSLVSENAFGIPRRTTIGVDHNRVSLLAAVMEKVCRINLGNHDIFINVAGGIKLDEPAVDLGIVASLMSSFMNRPIDTQTVVCGEVGLTGEVRNVGRVDERIKEAARMGFGRCILPDASLGEAGIIKGIERISIGTIRALAEHLFL